MKYKTCVTSMLKYLSFFSFQEKEKDYIYQIYDTVSVSKDFPDALGK